MATNPYFRSYDSEREQRLINELTIETIRAMGRDVLYIPRNYLNIDKIFGEDPEAKFTEGYPIEAYLVDVDRFQGNRDIISKFGVQITDRCTILLSKTRFEEEIKTKRNEIMKPRTGDLIYLPLSKSLFEINYVEDEFPFYQLGGLTTYVLTLELFTYDGESIDTGITDIDVIETKRKTAATLAYIHGTPITGSNEIRDGEFVFQVLGVTGNGATLSNATATATVVDIIHGTTMNTLYLSGISGSFSYNQTETVKGSISGAEYYFRIAGTTSDRIIPTDPFIGKNINDNNDLKQKTITIFDFSDIDPFSEGNY
jgi:hypothetical protein